MSNDEIENVRIFIGGRNLFPTYFNKGDLVKVKKLSNSPEMIVDRLIFRLVEGIDYPVDNLFEDLNESSYYKDVDGKKILLAIRCAWFDVNNRYIKENFHSKDLVKLD